MSSSLAGRATPPIDPRLLAVVRPRQIVRGWATVELERAERELLEASPPVAPPSVASPADAAGDVLLGARCRIIGLGDGVPAVLLEPASEGRLAAALARHGEAWLATYLIADRAVVKRLEAAAVVTTPASPGPLGPERRVVAGPRDGPFTLVVTPDPR